MKVLTTTGLTKLIELSKGTFLDKNNVIDVSDVLATVALTGSYNDLSNKPTIPTVDQTYSSTSTNAQSGTAVASAVSNKVDKVSTASKLYGTNSSGAQTTYSLTSAATANTIAYRTTDGVLSVGTPTSDAHAATKKYVDDSVAAVIPSQTGNSGKYLTTNGTAVSWATVDALPSQTGNSGKYLTTNGTTASWDALAAVANSGSYTDLTDKPTINDLTTSAQQAALNSGATSTNIAQITTNKNNISTINGKIPSAATSSNQLADKAFVNSSINAIAAYYVTSDAAGDAFATKAALDTGPYYHDGSTRTPTENDYAIVAADETHNNACTRYSYTGSQWSFQYVVNDTSFTQAQLDAINSGITSTKVGNYDTHIADTDIHVTTTDKSNWNAKQAAITGAASTVTSDNLTASRVLVSNSSGKIAADANVTTTELGYLDGVTSSIQTQLNNKVSKSGDSMTNNLEMTNGSVYLEGIGSSVSESTSKLVIGSPTNTYAYLTGNTSGAFGIYSETSGSRKGIACYPNSNFFADATTKTIDLGRSNNVWKTGYIDTLSNGASSITIANIIAKQDALVSGTNIKTINNNSILGSGNLTIDSLPAQSGKSGKYLTTNGTSASWADVPTEIPTQTGNSGKFLTTDGSAVSWATANVLPSQTGQSGKYLTTDGSSASWADVNALPSQSGQSGKYLTTNGTSASWVSLTIPTTTNAITSGSTAALTSGGAYTNVVTAVAAGTTNNKINVTKAGTTSTITINNVANATTASKLGSTTVGGVTQPIYLDSGTPTALSYTIEKSVPSDAVFTDHTYTNGAGINLTNGNIFSAKCDATTVSTNGSSQLQALGVINKKTSAAVYTWTGTKAQYDALGTYHNDWIYYITDDGTLTGDYYTKSQVDTMLYSTNHSVTKDTPYLILKDTNTNSDASTTPSSLHNGGVIQFKDKNNFASGYLYPQYATDGSVKQVLQAIKPINGTNVDAYISVGVKADGTKFTSAPTPAASTSTSNNNIATVGWINDPTKSTGLVHITGAETITGAKTFSGNNTFNGTDTFTGSTRFTGNPVFISDNNTDALTIKNDDDIYSVLPVETLSTNIALHDKNGEVIGGLEHYHQTDGTSISQMTARQHGGSNYSTIRVGIDISGNTWCNLPTDTYGTNFHGTSTRSMWADLAENYESDKEYPVGTLIRFGGEKDITIATINCNGVISDKPGYVLDSDLKNGQPVALVGKTPIRVLGKVNRFDRIVLDPEHPGLGKVQTTSDEKVIAIALKANSDVNEKLVMCVTKFNLD